MAEKKLTREQKKGVYRKAILEAAKQEFIRKGYKGASRPGSASGRSTITFRRKRKSSCSSSRISCGK